MQVQQITEDLDASVIPVNQIILTDKIGFVNNIYLQAVENFINNPLGWRL